MCNFLDPQAFVPSFFPVNKKKLITQLFDIKYDSKKASECLEKGINRALQSRVKSKKE